MVGFGSALRQSKRRGWEEAYVDYESLKLLLTQIEAVYEESNHYQYDDNNNTNYYQNHHYLLDDDFVLFEDFQDSINSSVNTSQQKQQRQRRAISSSRLMSSSMTVGTNSTKGGGGSISTTPTRKKKKNQKKKNRSKKKKHRKKKLDYRDELFVESDASFAYASLSDENNESDDSDVVDNNDGYDDHDGQNYDNYNGANNNNNIGAIYDENGNIIHYDHHFDQEGNHHHNDVSQRMIDDEESNEIDNHHLQQQNQSNHHHHHKNDNHNNRPRHKKSNSVLPPDANFNFSYSAPSYGSAETTSNSIHYGDSSGGLLSLGSDVFGFGGGSGGGSGHNNDTTLTSPMGGYNENGQYEFQPQQHHHPFSDSFDDHYHESDFHTLSPIPTTQMDYDTPPRHNRQQSPQQNQDINDGIWMTHQLNHHPNHHNHQQQQQRNSFIQKTTNKNNTQKQSKKKKKKMKRKSQVPPHLRIAHSKARAITERFLGLLRAEVDKICLFTHARMGELTDTCGSLRFPSDQMEYDGYNNMMERSHLGPIHPSASSSEDESPQQQHHRHQQQQQQQMQQPNTSNDGSIRGLRDDEKFVKPPLFPKSTNRRRNKSNSKAMDGTNRSREDIFSDEEDSIIHTSAFRHIKIGEELRCAKPTFQRSDYILGEDFLLLSAVDEADAYTTTGVEFLHLLKFICVNAIAIRKLCRKHDRLLASRMLGGYYHRLKKSQPNSYAISEFRNRRNNRQKQRSGMLEMSEHKLTGVYDSMVMSLANNTVAEDLSESLYLALSEYEVSRQRADALTKLQESNKRASQLDVADVGEEATCFHFPRPTFRLNYAQSNVSDKNNKTLDYEKDPDDHDALSTSSSISLTRLRFAIASIISLREAALLNYEHIEEFFSRSMMTNNGSTIIGEAINMHGCSSEFLHGLAQYNPDCTLLNDSHVLKKSLSIEDNGYFTSYRLSNKSDPVDDIIERSEGSLNALSIRSSNNLPTRKTSASGDMSLRFLNFSSIFLTTMNYYIIIPSAASFCAKSHGRYIDSVLLICAPSIAALPAILVQAYRFIGITEKSTEEMIYPHLLFSTLCPLIGNLLYSISYERRAVWFAFLSRFVIGLSSSDTINKEFIATGLDANKVAQDAASMRKFHLAGIFFGLLLGSLDLIDETEIDVYGHVFNIGFETIPGYLMFIAWSMQVFFLIFSPHSKSLVRKEQTIQSSNDIYIDLTPSASDNEDFQTPMHPSMQRHNRTNSDQSKLDYYMKRLERNISETSPLLDSKEASKHDKRSPVKSDRIESAYETLVQTIKSILQEFALSTTMTLVIFSNVTIEMVLSSFIIVTHRYFDWSGPEAGVFLSILALLIVPLNISASFWSQRYGERCVLKKSLLIMLVALLIIINYQSLFILMSEIHHLLRQYFEVEKEASQNYDWDAGVYQYCIGTFFIFTSAILTECTSLNLMSKVSNEKLNSSVINFNILIPFIERFGKVLGAAIVFLVGISHRLIYMDIVNSMAFFLIGMTVICRYIIKKHYFFLYGDN